MVEEQYPQPPTFSVKKLTDQLFALIAESGPYFPNLVACNDSMFFSQGQGSSRIISVLWLLCRGE